MLIGGGKPTINQALYDVALETRPQPPWEICLQKAFISEGVVRSFVLQSCPSLAAVFYARNSAVANVPAFADTVQHTWDSTQMPAKGYLGLCDLLPTVSQGAALICTLTLLDGVASHVLSHPRCERFTLGVSKHTGGRAGSVVFSHSESRPSVSPRRVFSGPLPAAELLECGPILRAQLFSVKRIMFTNLKITHTSQSSELRNEALT